MLVLVDVVLGPSLTLVIAAPHKKTAELRRDVLVVVALQSLALFYGVKTLYEARPVAIVFNVNRFDVVGADEISLVGTSERVALLSRPKYVWVELPSLDEQQSITFDAAAGGPDFKNLLRLHRDWPAPPHVVAQHAKPVTAIPVGAPILEDVTEITRRAAKPDAIWIEVIGRSSEGVVVLGRDNLEVLGIAVQR